MQDVAHATEVVHAERKWSASCFKRWWGLRFLLCIRETAKSCASARYDSAMSYYIHAGTKECLCCFPPSHIFGLVFFSTVLCQHAAACPHKWWRQGCGEFASAYKRKEKKNTLEEKNYPPWDLVGFLHTSIIWQFGTCVFSASNRKSNEVVLSHVQRRSYCADHDWYARTLAALRST